MKRLLISCLIVCGCNDTAIFPGGSAHTTGDTSNSSVSNVNSFNPVTTTTNNGVASLGCDVKQTTDPDTGKTTFEGSCIQVDPVTGATTAILSGPDPVTALTSQCCQQPASSSSASEGAV